MAVCPVGKCEELEYKIEPVEESGSKYRCAEHQVWILRNEPYQQHRQLVLSEFDRTYPWEAKLCMQCVVDWAVLLAAETTAGEQPIQRVGKLEMRIWDAYRNGWLRTEGEVAMFRRWFPLTKLYPQSEGQLATLVVSQVVNVASPIEPKVEAPTRVPSWGDEVIDVPTFLREHEGT